MEAIQSVSHMEPNGTRAVKAFALTVLLGGWALWWFDASASMSANMSGMPALVWVAQLLSSLAPLLLYLALLETIQDSQLQLVFRFASVRLFIAAAEWMNAS